MFNFAKKSHLLVQITSYNGKISRIKDTVAIDDNITVNCPKWTNKTRKINNKIPSINFI